MIRIKLAMLIGGIVLAVIGVQEWRLSRVAKDAPQTISCADLAASGPGANANIVLKDYFMVMNAFVYESKKNNPTWNKIWVPVVPLGGEYHQKIMAMVTPDGKLNGVPPVPQDIKVIVKSSKVPDQSALGQLADQDTMTGLVTNQIESLGTKEREILASSYPGIDFTKCWIIDHDRKPAGMGQIAGFTGGGAVLTLLGLGWLLAGYRPGPKA